VDIFKGRGLNHARWVPFGCDPSVHRPVELTAKERTRYARDIVFVGSFYPNRAKLLSSIADLDLQIWGPYWSKAKELSLLKNKFIDVKMNYDQWVKIYRAAKIVLVVHYQSPNVPCHQASPKLFEAMACQACVFVDNQKDARALFESGRHAVFFRR